MDGITVGPFRGDLDDLHRMAVDSWRDEYKMTSFPDLYHPAYVGWLTRGVAPDHLVAAYDGDQCIAFVANLPRTIVLAGTERRACLAGLLTCRKAYLRRGVAEQMIRSALALNDRHAYDLVYFYLETGHRSTRLFDKLRGEGFRIAPLRRLYPWARVLDLARVDASEGLKGYERAVLRLLEGVPAARPLDGVRDYRAADLDDCLRLINAHAGRVDLARRFSAAELAPTLDAPPVARTIVVERDGRAAALVNWVTHRHLGRTAEAWAWIAHAALHDISPRERRLLYRAFLRRVADDGCVGVIEWGMGYHPLGPLLANRFVPYPRSVTLVAWPMRPDLPMPAVRTLFDIQV